MPPQSTASGPASRNPQLYLGSRPTFGERADRAIDNDAEVLTALERSERLWTVGKQRAALESIKAAIRAHPTSTEIRLALAERYRSLNCPDQAGRWGIVRAGWTTDVERDRLARLLAPVGVARDDLAEFLQLPGAVESYPDLQEVVDGPLAAHVAARRAGGGTGTSPWADRLFTIAAICWATAVIGVILTGIGVFFIAFFDLADTRTVARVASACVLAVIAAACWVGAEACDVERRWLASAALTLSGVFAAALALVIFATTWTTLAA